MKETVLSIRNLTIGSLRDADRQLITDLSLDVESASCTALVGESGCGKTLTAMSVLRMEQAHGGRLLSGEVQVAGHDMVNSSERSQRAVRRDRVGFVPQDPGASLSPVMSIGRQLRGVVRLKGVPESALETTTRSLLTEVQLTEHDRILRAYPHQLSGGMRQRVIIAMALAGDPQLLVADEPTTALDVSVQARIMELFDQLLETRRIGMLLITHDVALTRQHSQQVHIMYAGEVVASGTSEQLLANPQHPYSQALLNCLPQSHQRGSEIPAIPGRVPLGGRFPDGCRFHPRCPQNDGDRCGSQAQTLLPISDGREVRCWQRTDLTSPAAAQQEVGR